MVGFFSLLPHRIIQDRLHAQHVCMQKKKRVQMDLVKLLSALSSSVSFSSWILYCTLMHANSSYCTLVFSLALTNGQLHKQKCIMQPNSKYTQPLRQMVANVWVSNPLNLPIQFDRDKNGNQDLVSFFMYFSDHLYLRTFKQSLDSYSITIMMKATSMVPSYTISKSSPF